MAEEPQLVTIGQEKLRCVFCEGALFRSREVMLNTGAMEFLGFAWANPSATGLVCAYCGYVHTFLSDSIRYWEPEGGYPAPQELADLEAGEEAG